MASRNDYGQKSDNTSSFFAQPTAPIKKAQSPNMLRSQRFFESVDSSVISAPVLSAPKNNESLSRSSTSSANPLEENAFEDSIGEKILQRQGLMVHQPPRPLPETQTLPENNPEDKAENITPQRPMNGIFNGEPVLEDMTPGEAMHHIRTHDVGEAFDRFSNTFNGLLAEKHPILTKHVDTMFNCNKIFHTHRTLLEHRRDGLHKRKIEALGSAENFRKKCMVALPDCLNVEENELRGD